MTSFKRTTYSLILLFVVGFFCSFYAEAQRVRGKRQRGNPETAERMDSVQGDSLYTDSLALADTTRKKKEPLDAPVQYEAADSIVFTQGGYAHLFGDGSMPRSVCRCLVFSVEIFFHLVDEIRHQLHHPVQGGHSGHGHRQHPGGPLLDDQEGHRLDLHPRGAAAAEVLGLDLSVVSAAAADAQAHPGDGDQRHPVRRGDGLAHDGVGVHHLVDLVHRGAQQVVQRSLLLHRVLCLVHGIPSFLVTRPDVPPPLGRPAAVHSVCNMISAISAPGDPG